MKEEADEIRGEYCADVRSCRWGREGKHGGFGGEVEPLGKGTD